MWIFGWARLGGLHGIIPENHAGYVSNMDGFLRRKKEREKEKKKAHDGLDFCHPLTEMRFIVMWSLPGTLRECHQSTDFVGHRPH